MYILQRLWADEAGFAVSAELVMICTILVLGSIVGLTTVRDQLVQELADVAAAIGTVNQSYSFSAITGHHSSTAGSFFIDLIDSCEVSCSNDVSGAGANCVNVCGVPATHEDP